MWFQVALHLIQLLEYVLAQSLKRRIINTNLDHKLFGSPKGSNKYIYIYFIPQ